MPKLRLAFVLLVLIVATPAVADGFDASDGPARNLSGIACTNIPDDCLVIDNEGRFAQRATLDLSGNRSLDAGDKVNLVPDDIDKLVALGHRQPRPDCVGNDKHFGALDGEAIAAIGGTYFITGSHGCTRNGDDQKASAFLTARLRGNTVELSFRLREAIEAFPVLADHFGQALPAGLSIEGLAAIGDRLVFGFRSPAPYLLTVNQQALFTDNIPLGAPQPVLLPLPHGLGIRDLAPLADGRLLVLAGPVGKGDDPFALYLWDDQTFVLTRLRDLHPNGEAHPEGLLVLSETTDKAELLILNDGVKNGRPDFVTSPLR